MQVVQLSPNFLNSEAATLVRSNDRFLEGMPTNLVHKYVLCHYVILQEMLSVYLQIQIVMRNAIYVSISLSTFLRYLSRLLSLSSIRSVPHRTAEKKQEKQKKKTVIQDDISICSVYRETRLDKYWSQRHNMFCLSFGYGAGKSVNALATQIHKYSTTDPI